jgi:transcriptional regulator GlxA family with amidase domain
MGGDGSLPGRLRLRMASVLLGETTLPVSEIMRRVGFGDATHFGRTFRKYTGYPPSEYRQRFNPELQAARQSPFS